jgi:hypothetical protein
MRDLNMLIIDGLILSFGSYNKKRTPQLWEDKAVGVKFFSGGFEEDCLDPPATAGHFCITRLPATTTYLHHKNIELFK